VVVSGQRVFVLLDVSKHVATAKPRSGESGDQRPSTLVGGKCVVILFEPEKNIPAANPRFTEIGPLNERLVKRIERLVIATELGQDVASAEIRFGGGRHQCQCPVEGSERFVVTFYFRERATTAMPGGS